MTNRLTLLPISNWAQPCTAAIAFCFIAFSVTFEGSYNLFSLMIILSYSFFCIPSIRKKINLSSVEKSLILVILIYSSTFIFEITVLGNDLRIFDKPAKALLLIPLILLLNATKVSSQLLTIAFIIGSILLLTVAIYDVYILGKYRATGPINPIQFGTIAIAISATAMALTASIHIKPTRKIIWLSILICLAGSGLLAGLLTQSRGSIIAIPVILILITSLYLFLHRASKYQTLIWLVVIIFTSTTVIHNSPVFERFKEAVINSSAYIEKNKKKRSSSAIRLGLWEIGIQAGLQSPIIGVGYNQLVEYKKQQVKQGVYHKKLLIFNSSHNTYINAFARRGLIGLGGVILFLGFPVFLGLRIWARGPAEIAPYAAGLTAFGGVFAISNITQEVIFLNNGIIMYTGLLIILTYLLGKKSMEGI